MHELPLTKGIFKSVMRKAESVDAAAINRVVLEIGVLQDFIPEYVQKYWDYISRGTIAEGSLIEIRDKDGEAECGRCHTHYNITRANMFDVHCPSCGYEYGNMLSGNELRIVGIEIVKKET